MKIPNNPTIDEYIDAIEKNGYPQAFGQLYVFKDELGNIWHQPKREVIAACALGQALLNLQDEGFDPINDVASFGLLHDGNLLFQYEGWERTIVGATTYLNDEKHLPLKEIAKTLRKLIPAKIRKQHIYKDEVPA